jgi:hypothetical protein
MGRFLLTVAIAALSYSAARADIPEIVACADKADPKARLACYDAAVVKLKGELAETENRERSLFGFKMPFTSAEPDSGEDAKPKLSPRNVNEIDANVTSWKVTPIGHFILTLDNDQVWLVKDSRPVPLSAGKDTRVAIVRNMMGGFYMGVNGVNNDLSVIRIK